MAQTTKHAETSVWEKFNPDRPSHLVRFTLGMACPTLSFSVNELGHWDRDTSPVTSLWFASCPIPFSENPEDAVIALSKSAYLLPLVAKNVSCEYGLIQCSHDLVPRSFFFFNLLNFSSAKKYELKTNQSKTNRKGWICISIYWKKIIPTM